MTSTVEKQRTVVRVGLAADHGGFALKQALAEQLQASGYTIVDFGAFHLDAGDDYPDFVIPLARAVAEGRVERGLALCGSGVGASVAANKVAGARAALIHDIFSAHQGVDPVPWRQGDRPVPRHRTRQRLSGRALQWPATSSPQALEGGSVGDAHSEA